MGWFCHTPTGTDKKREKKGLISHDQRNSSPQVFCDNCGHVKPFIRTQIHPTHFRPDHTHLEFTMEMRSLSTSWKLNYTQQCILHKLACQSSLRSVNLVCQTERKARRSASHCILRLLSCQRAEELLRLLFGAVCFFFFLPSSRAQALWVFNGSESCTCPQNAIHI